LLLLGDKLKRNETKRNEMKNEYVNVIVIVSVIVNVIVIVIVIVSVIGTESWNVCVGERFWKLLKDCVWVWVCVWVL